MLADADKVGRWGRRLILAFAALVTVAALKQHYAFYLVSGESMLPTLANHELILVDKMAYATGKPRRGDIVVAEFEGDQLVKRIVGLPEQTVEVRDGIVYVDGTAMDERDHVLPGDLNIRKGSLFEGKFALLGDNRSLALPVYGVVPERQIRGKVLLSASFARGVRRHFSPAI